MQHLNPRPKRWSEAHFEYATPRDDNARCYGFLDPILEQTGFADARLARDKDDPPLAANCIGERLVEHFEFPGAPDKRADLPGIAPELPVASSYPSRHVTRLA